ncbi:unnamed protein product [marine sediment metagenome]|uniref:AB hydrolase-1 domain-containing protein n=1 Tax=marine sediment metagenome TaxID=412755 RepID=X1BYM3_9ZZZZ
MSNIIFIHGLESSGQGFKGNLLRKELPGCLTPDFKEFTDEITFQRLLEKRMAQLKSILIKKDSWIIIGSSFGGLMGALYTRRFPEKVNVLILLAPLLTVSELNPDVISPINIPVIIYHGRHDTIVSLQKARSRAEKIFLNLKFNEVDDDHMLHSTVSKIDWKKLIMDT